MDILENLHGSIKFDTARTLIKQDIANVEYGIQYFEESDRVRFCEMLFANVPSKKDIGVLLYLLSFINSVQLL